MEAIANSITPGSAATSYQREVQRPLINPDIEKVTRRAINSSDTDNESQPLTKRQVACAASASVICAAIGVVLVVFAPKEGSFVSTISNVAGAMCFILTLAFCMLAIPGKMRTLDQ